MSTATIIASLRNAITHKAPFINGTIPLPSPRQNLFYKSPNSSNSSCVDLANTTPDQLESLTQACEPATFGRDKRDVLDESYRKAGKMDKENFATQLDLTALRLIDRIQKNLLGDYENARPVVAELYKLNVYGKDSFFKSHKDTPRSESMFGSLVIVFPTTHEGGAFVLRHNDKEWTFDPSEMLSHYKNQPSFAYIAFYSDVDHEVLPVQSGHRVTLTYNLYFDTESSSNVADSAIAGPGSELKDVLIAALENDTFLPEGGRLGFGLNFKYPVQPDTDLVAMAGRLKGNDAIIKSVCDELGLATSLNAIYFPEESYAGKMMVLTNSIVDLGIMQVDEDLTVHMLQEHDGKIVDEPGLQHKILRSWDSGWLTEPLTDYLVEVLWVTSLTSASLFSTAYVAYGNEATLTHAYGDLCLIVEVEKSSDRHLLRKRKRSKKDS